MNCLIMLADGFETVEALQTYDLLKRTHRFDVKLCGVYGRSVRSSQGVLLEAEIILDEICPNDYDFIILPGGKLGVENLKKSEVLLKIIQDFIREGKDVHAICAAPSILGMLGLLDELNYTCFPGFQTGKGTWVDAGVVKTTHIITGRSMGFTMDFAKAIIAHYYGEEAVEAIRPGVEGLC